MGEHLFQESQPFFRIRLHFLMSVELAVIVRKLLDKIDLVIDIRENLYPGLYKRSNLFEIVILCNRHF